MSEVSIDIRGLSFRYRPGDPAVLDGVTFQARPGRRYLVVGANGAGKTTLLRVVAGKHLIAEESVRVLGRPAFHDTSLADHVELLGGPFPFEVDVEVASIIDGVRGVSAARRDALIELLGVDLGWHMHRISDGQRRRVQILLGLLRPSRVLLLDEVTTDLDVIARQDLLAFLRAESETEGTTILYATHIFDSLDEWATDLVYMVRGAIALACPLADVTELAELRASGRSSPLLHLVDRWLRRDA